MTSKETIKEIQRIAGATADGLWGPNTLKAVACKLGCPASVKDVQAAVGVTADGIVGPKTLSAVYSRLSAGSCGCPAGSGTHTVFIDPGHTSDYEREHPSQFTGVDWKSGKPLEIVRILGLDRNPNDSVEHALNCAIANALNSELRGRGKFETMLYDNPSLSNGSEIGQVYKRSNAFNPDVFISIHCNAQGGSKWKSLGGTASGAVGLYCAKNSKNSKLAQSVVNAINAYRKEAKACNNRAETLSKSSVGVLANADPSIAACLVEVGFYDNLDDLYWMCTHLKGLAAAIADGISGFLG